MPSLFLCASDPCWIPPDRTAFVRLLHDLGLIECVSATAGTEDSYRVGPKFLGLVTFLGCSPSVVVDPRQAAEGQQACFLRQHMYSDVRFMAAAGSARVRCPCCRRPAADIPTSDHDAPFICGQCREITPVSALDWRQSAGFGRCFLEIGGIYPHEALPSDRLLDTLQDYSGAAWRYFYAG